MSEQKDITFPADAPTELLREKHVAYIKGWQASVPPERAVNS